LIKKEPAAANYPKQHTGFATFATNLNKSQLSTKNLESYRSLRGLNRNVSGKRDTKNHIKQNILSLKKNLRNAVAVSMSQGKLQGSTIANDDDSSASDDDSNDMRTMKSSKRVSLLMKNCGPNSKTRNLIQLS
jgi:hypothetical protein